MSAHGGSSLNPVVKGLLFGGLVLGIEILLTTIYALLVNNGDSVWTSVVTNLYDTPPDNTGPTLWSMFQKVPGSDITLGVWLAISVGFMVFLKGITAKRHSRKLELVRDLLRGFFWAFGILTLLIGSLRGYWAYVFQDPPRALSSVLHLWLGFLTNSTLFLLCFLAIATGMIIGAVVWYRKGNSSSAH